MKKKLLILLGAGSSVSNGMPTVQDLDRHLRALSDNWTVHPGAENYFASLWASIDRYYRAEPKPSLRKQPNFEIVLAEMVALANWMTPPPYGTAFREAAAGSSALPPGLRFPGTPRAFDAAGAVNSQLIFLLSSLAKHMRAQSSGLNTRTPEFDRYRRLFRGLRDQFEIGIYNLNYDSLALRAWRKAFTGFRANLFAPADIHRRREWGFLYHLHGSIHHSLAMPFGSEIRWESNLSAAFDDGGDGRSTDIRSDGKSIPKTTLIAGGFKLDQLLIEPFQAFYASFVRHVSEADAILIGGYGFGDVHVNRVFQNRLSGTSLRPPVMVLSRAVESTDPMQLRADVWSESLCRTLDVGSDSFSEPGHTAPPTISDLMARNGFEVSAKAPVAIWHGGFVEVGSRLGAMCDWLAGKRSASTLAGKKHRASFRASKLSSD